LRLTPVSHFKPSACLSGVSFSLSGVSFSDSFAINYIANAEGSTWAAGFTYCTVGSVVHATGPTRESGVVDPPVSYPFSTSGAVAGWSGALFCL